jgi:heme O synthase-like polyprenyltransferase
MNRKTFKKIIGVLVILLIVAVTFKFIKIFPPVMKIVALGANVATIYFAVNLLIKEKAPKNKKNKTENYGN